MFDQRCAGLSQGFTTLPNLVATNQDCWAEPPYQTQIRILLIEDSPQIRDFIVDYILTPHEFTVDVAVNGREGLSRVLAQPPDLILTDYEMPGLSGLDVLRELRKAGQKVPVILMTSHGSEHLAVEFFRLGVQDYLIKPFEAAVLLDSIENALSLTHLKNERDALIQRVIQTNHQLEAHLQDLNTLYQVGKSVTTLQRPREVLKQIVDAVLQVTGGDECTLTLLETETGKSQVSLKKSREDGALPVTGQILSVPLRVGPKVIGALSVTKQYQADFSPNDNRLLQMLADYAAIALHNLQLVHQLNQTKEQEKQQIRNLFERYVAPTVVEQLLAQPEQVKLGGTRRRVTVLFADVRGFSGFSAQTTPELLVDLLNRYMHLATEAILSQQGTLDKFMGDAVMAFFNAPLWQDDHPLRAVRAAFALCQAVKQLHPHLPARYRLEFGVGIGVGEAVVGNIGTAHMMNYTVIGDAVNRVKRLQENAAGGQVLINQETYDLLADQVQVRSLGRFQLKGQRQLEPVYEVLALAPPAAG